MKVRDVMTPKAKVINFEHSVFEAAQIMLQEDCGSVPVEKDDKMIGMITDRDITIRVVAQGKDPRRTKVEEVMSEGINYCFEEDSIEEVNEKMSRHQHRRLPVVNKDKRLVGMVSLGDVANRAKDARLSHEILSNVSHH
ncbi:inosine-5-monophosphate dehydrogenase [Bdellovibrio bacteriovorus]|uniref:Inosine-5-monophosphate dehydrogenase n=1 Tax=Bdellovibrio bacteriovorus TaxID=959 RepID=A0A150WIY1_BDEBC|nr:CBS domain-containing protein [Bdellovibrio bacteriovorus]KYG63449.1 inosine-5-monophosphate dehydrogenase [Bdellovibrio bacteriovorus]